MKINKFAKYFLFAVALIISLSAAAQAITTVTPGDSAHNPVSDALYVIDNSVPRIKVYTMAPSGWNDSGNTITLPAGSKCYGMAVSPDGATLYVSVSNGSNSAVQAYGLSVPNGMPNGSVTTMTGAYWATASSPAGMAVGGNNRLFVADQGVGRFLIFDTANNTYVKAVTTNLAGKTNLYDIAVTSTTAGSYKIYLSRKVSAGEIYVFDYGQVNDTVIYNKVINTGLSHPTYLKVKNDRLYTAVNGSNEVAVKAYSTADESFIGDVTCDITGSYGWNAFDLNAEGSVLVFKKAQNASENPTKIYRVNTSAIPAAGAAITSTIKADGVAISNNGQHAGLSNSPDGNFENYSATVGNFSPDYPTNLVQYAYDGTTVLEKGEETDHNTVVFEFQVNDPEGDPMTVKAAYRLIDNNSSAVYQTMEAVPSGTTVRFTFEGIANNEYEWMAWVKDTYHEGFVSTAYGGDGFGNGNGGSADFIINTGAGEFQITETYPANNATNVPLNAPVSVKFNREVNPSTFSINITPTVPFDGAVWSEGNTRVSLSHVGNNYSTGQQYTFNISAQSAQAEALTGQTSFTFTASTNPDDLAPYITSTTPIASATNVTLNQEVVIDFSRDINPNSFTYNMTPNPGAWTVEWNSPTRVTLVHGNQFAANTGYEFEVLTAAGTNGLALIPGIAPNPFTFETGTSAGDPIVNIEVTREGDDPGDGITITWDTLPPGIGVDVYKLTCPTDANGEYTSYFTTAAASWTLAQANVTIGTYTVQNQVGQGTAEYYKLIPTGNTLQNSDLTTNVVGKFDIAVGPEVERFFISSPLELSDSTIVSVIGAQVAETDMIMSFNIDKDVVYGSVFSSGVWDTYPGSAGPITNLEVGYTYGYYTPTTRFITLVGMVRETNYNRTLDGGTTPVANWLANPYPVPVDIVDAGLNNTSYNSNPLLAATAYHFNANADTIGDTDGVAVHANTATWLDGTLDAPAALQIVPGKGYMLTEPVQNTFIWNMAKPY